MITFCNWCNKRSAVIPYDKSYDNVRNKKSPRNEYDKKLVQYEIKVKAIREKRHTRYFNSII
jgi:hypothetical protein